MCARWWVPGECFVDCNNKASHIGACTVPQAKCTKFRKYLEKVRRENSPSSLACLPRPGFCNALPNTEPPDPSNSPRMTSPRCTTPIITPPYKHPYPNPNNNSLVVSWGISGNISTSFANWIPPDNNPPPDFTTHPTKTISKGMEHANKIIGKFNNVLPMGP